MISEQHLFFRGNELENDKILADYKINKGDTLQLKVILNILMYYIKFDSLECFSKKLDQSNKNFDDHDSQHYELAHLPEVGFKGRLLCFSKHCNLK
jgi:hypothetical protein